MSDEENQIPNKYRNKATAALSKYSPTSTVNTGPVMYLFSKVTETWAQQVSSQPPIK